MAGRTTAHRPTVLPSYGHGMTRDSMAGGGPRVDGAQLSNNDLGGWVRRAFLRAGGLGAETVKRRPIIGICSSWSELNPCNMGLAAVADAVKRGVIAAGGTPLV